MELIGLLCMCKILCYLFRFFWCRIYSERDKNIDRFLSITTNIFRIQAFDSIMCRYFCSGFIDFMLAGKTLTEYKSLSSPNNLMKNDDIILNYFMSNI